MYEIEGAKDGGVPPNKPNFLLIVILSGVAIFVVLGIAYFALPNLVHGNPAHPDRHPTSQLFRPHRSYAA